MAESANKKRPDYLIWSDYFMGIAHLSGQRSKDPSTQVGACIVNKDKRIVGTGYNGMPNDCHDDVMPWGKTETGKDPSADKLLYVCHAEMNAILNKNSADLKDCKIYTTLFPCNECAKLIIQSGITKVIYLSDKHADRPETKASQWMLEIARVKLKQFVPTKPKIVIDFESLMQAAAVP